MSNSPNISIVKAGLPDSGIAVVLVGEDGALGPQAKELFDLSGGSLQRAMDVADFKGKSQSLLDVVAPAGLALSRVILAGTGKAEEFGADAALKLGGSVMGKLKDIKAETITVLFDKVDGSEADPVLVAEFAMGLRLRAYEWSKHKTVKKDEKPPKMTVSIATEGHSKARKAFADNEEIAAGVMLARDLVNEAPNVLGPVEYAKICEGLTEFGLEVEILTDKDMKKLGMGALLGVAQGSVRPARLAVMRWNGGKAKETPVAFVGKGVVFDTGGISIKPAAGMEDMKGDMGGSAAVVGLMRALAGRKAKINAVGVIGLVENMPDGNAYRPGDILTSMSGQTIEVINTDAEGRLVLADALWYTKETFKPAFMVNLATLTGACMVALGTQHAGLFSNDDELATRLYDAGQTTGEKLWRLPLGPDYDKLIDSRFADMKNTGGRYGGAITAAQFLKRFVGETAWAHLDVAGTAMASADTETNRSWGNGFGVRLLNRLVADHYEK
ncbi:Cytosol aminopeptidase [Hartmannibacter diazotrophicus]|uniref:Probable cytosol aminopeptidase n=1 Tax=Hartmannibacter diazotrophicus TaxID=1482074 RepID=A0A2C9D8R1_9HYPH|nr:leucyl aminopeptidase [Hartmannibacter diazotrophicus]SON55965.1 Cytosol aminopeptidase [Hartmannibacter diazotrophicus]